MLPDSRFLANVPTVKAVFMFGSTVIPLLLAKPKPELIIPKGLLFATELVKFNAPLTFATFCGLNKFDEDPCEIEEASTTFCVMFPLESW